MARPTDWSAVDLPIDPVPGDPMEIRQSASGARSIERAITEQVNRLNSLKDGDGWESESGTKFRDSAGDLAGAIEKAKGRYTQLAAALDDWANGLEGIQQEADAALARAQEAQDAHRAAAGQTLTAAPDTPEHQDQVDAQDRALSAAQGDIDAAKAIIHRIAGPSGLAGEYGDLSDRVASRIRDGADDGMKDGWFDHVKQAIHDAKGVLEAIKSVLNVVAIALLVVAMFIPGVNVLIAIAWAGVAIATAVFLITAAQAAAGDATTEDVLWAAVGVAASAVGVGAVKAAGQFLRPLTTSTIRSGVRTAGNFARGAGLAEGPAMAAKSAELTAKVAKIEGFVGVKIFDGIFLNGALAPTLIRTLAKGGPIAQQALPQILRPALIASVLGLKPTLDGFQQLWDDSGNLVHGTYWREATKVEIGSL
jgi:hypothetical protein